ncbi:MAG: hypothetical protein GWN47_07155 [Woeseiaceae bacterium]|nr:hypothetical protein [Woeseiaceae bacterium]
MTIIDLWLPVAAATLVMFAASAVIWTVFKWHNADYRRLADEAGARAGLTGNPPGFYLLPYCVDPKELEQAEVRQKYEQGPIGYITMLPNGVPPMGAKMVTMFVYFLVVSILCAYVVSRTLHADADYLAVFRVAGTVTFIANSFALVPESIWFGRPWRMTARNFLDALIYSLLAGGVFGWLV